MIPPDLLPLLTCPRCGSSLDLKALPPEDSLIVCPDCREEYPFIGGVLGLFYVDEAWFWPVHEMIALNETARKALAGELEPDRVARNTVEVRNIMAVATEMSDRAIASLPAPAGQTLLEVGSGSCTQAKELADRGFQVLAVDLNPVELLHPRPRYIDRLGEMFHAEYFDSADEFPPEEIRFLRIAADIHNLPLRGAAVDFIHSRSMLHHLNPVAPALTEVGRTIRPGGYWNASAEPAQSALEMDPESVLDTSIDYQEGVHEKFPSIREYLRGFRKGRLDLVRYEVWSARRRINLGLRRQSRFRLTYTGPEIVGQGPLNLPLRRAYWMNTVGNFILRKGLGLVGRNPLHERDRERRAKAEWFFDPDSHRREIHAALRSLVPKGALAEPAVLGKLSQPEIQVRGFRLTEWVGDRPVRFATLRAYILLPEPRGAKRLQLDLFNPHEPGGEPLRLSIAVNEVEAAEIVCDRPGFSRETIDLPPEAAGSRDPIEVELRTDRVVLLSDGRCLGIAVERIAYDRS